MTSRVVHREGSRVAPFCPHAAEMRHIEGVTTRRMLLDSGLGEDAIDAMLERGELVQHQRGVYFLEGVVADHRHRMIAVLLAIGPLVAVTGLFALWVRGHIAAPDGPVDVLVPHPRNPTRRRDARLRATTCFELCGMTRIGIIPVVSTAWAITDVARHASHRELCRLIADGVGARWISLDRIRDAATARGVFPGSRRLGQVLKALGGEVSYSKTEHRLARACRRAGLDVVLNREVHDGAGGLVATVDLWVDGLRLAIEVDGPRHWLPEVAAWDRRRDRRLHAMGCRVVRFSVYEIDDDIDAVVREILSVATDLRAAA